VLEVIKTILTSDAGSITFVLAIIGGGIWLAFKIGKVSEQYGALGEIKTDIRKIFEDIIYVKGSLNLMTRGSKPLTETNSPIGLSDSGIEVANSIHIDKIIDRQWKELCKRIERMMKSKNNPYDIQQVCFDIGKRYFKLITSLEKDSIKEYAYSSGYNLYDFDIIFGIKIRDKYLKEKNISVLEVDKHTPDIKK
jgi:hypothetical protein